MWATPQEHYNLGLLGSASVILTLEMLKVECPFACTECSFVRVLCGVAAAAALRCGRERLTKAFASGRTRRLCRAPACCTTLWHSWEIQTSLFTQSPARLWGTRWSLQIANALRMYDGSIQDQEVNILRAVRGSAFACGSALICLTAAVGILHRECGCRPRLTCRPFAAPPVPAALPLPAWPMVQGPLGCSGYRAEESTRWEKRSRNKCRNLSDGGRGATRRGFCGCERGEFKVYGL